MARSKQNNPDPPITRKIEPAATPEEREQQIIALAIERMQQRIVDGTATGQELIHWAKLGSQKSKLEMERLREENQLLKAKTESIKSEKLVAEMFAEAIAAMKSYQPPPDEEEYEE